MNNIVIEKVRTKKQRKEFVNFPLKLYKNCKYFIPPLYADEMALFTDKNVYNDTCKSEFFIAYKDGKVVGRIQGIIQLQFNEIHKEKRVRFTRFDCIDDLEVSKALFDALYTYAKENQMDTICGPLGYSDLEREGLLIEGFEEVSTFEEQYNYPYYQKLIENEGFKKEVDWVESKIYLPDEKNFKIPRVAKKTLELNKLHVGGVGLSKSQYIKKYKDGIFECLDETYKHLYGTVPFTEKMKQQIVSQFMLLLNKEYLLVICDENERVVSFALCLPGIGKSLQKSGGRLNPISLIKLMWEAKHPKVIDLALIGVLPEYQARGVNAVALNGLVEMMEKSNIDHLETNLNLEENNNVQAQWKYFKSIQHKRRRSYVKNI